MDYKTVLELRAGIDRLDEKTADLSARIEALDALEAAAASQLLVTVDENGATARVDPLRNVHPRQLGGTAADVRLVFDERVDRLQGRVQNLEENLNAAVTEIATLREELRTQKLAIQMLRKGKKV